MKRIIAVFMALLVAIQIFSVSFAVDSEQDWEVDITEIETYQKLETEQQEVNYDGSIALNKFKNEPSNGNVYILAEISVLYKGSSKGINLSDTVLKIGKNTYNRVKKDTFLANHNFKTLSHGEVLFGNYTGIVLFEVPKNDANSDKNNWDIIVDGV